MNARVEQLEGALADAAEDARLRDGIIREAEVGEVEEVGE